MKNCKNLLTKIWLIATLAIVLGGIVLLSVLGFNNTTDFSKGYELTVKVAHKVDNQDVIPETTEKFFEENNILNEKYSKVYINDGTGVIYSFDDVVEIDKVALNALKLKIEEALDNSLAQVSVEFKEFKTNNQNRVLFFALALLISAIIIFLFTLILGKLKVALITLIASVGSLISYLGMVALFRVPIFNVLGVFTSIAFIFGFILSLILAINFRQIIKLVSTEKLSLEGVANKGVKNNLFKFICIAVIILVLAIAMLIFGGVYLKFVALHLVLSAVSSFAVALIGVPFLWTLSKQK